MIWNLIDNINNTHIESTAGVYEIPRQDCNKNMCGNLIVSIKEFMNMQRNLKRGNLNTGLVKHN